MNEKEKMEALEWIEAQRRFNKAAYFDPFPKQIEFFSKGASKRERLLMAANQVGKTEAGAFESACHLTGIYPKWWPGFRFNKPTRGWAAGETGLVVRDAQQKKLFGPAGVEADRGTGYIPKDKMLDWTLARGVTDAYDTVQVRHVSGGTSTITFKSYEQGREKFQADTIDWGWADEEPSMEIYTEMLTRTNSTGGFMYTTFTPMLGQSEVVLRFTDQTHIDRALITMTLDDALHLSEDRKRQIIESYPAYQRDARTRGIPLLGSGAIFPYAESGYIEAPINHVPQHFAKIWGLDFGIDHPFGAALILWDKDADIIHVHHAFRVTDQMPLQHAQPMIRFGADVPVAWPQDGAQRDKGSLEPLAKQYKSHGLRMLDSHAKWPDGSNSTEAGVLEMQERLTTGRLKIASHLSDLLEEMRGYHRAKGLIVKKRDDIISALRVAIMMKRFARPVVLGSHRVRQSASTIAQGVDFDVFSNGTE